MSAILGQTNSLNIEGLGEFRQFTDPGMTALGNSWFFSGQTNGIALSSPATQWRSDLSHISASSTFSVVQFDSYSDQKSNLFNYLKISIPVGKAKTIGFGLTPKTRTGFNITDEHNNADNIYFNGDFISTDLKYHGNGGVSELLISYSQSITKNFAGGIQWHIGFGNLLLVDTLITRVVTPVDFDVFIYKAKFTDTFEKKYKFRGNAVNLSGLFSQSAFEFAASLTLDQNMIVQTEQNYYTNSSIYTGTEFLAESEHTYDTSVNLRNFGAGIAYKPRNDLGVVWEFHHSQDNSIPSNLLLFGNKKGKMNSLSTGIFKWIKNTRPGLWNTIILRGGIYGKNITRNTENYLDIGLTLGFGLEYFKRTSNLNLAVKFGVRENGIPELEGEKYAEIIIGLTSSEKWFTKRKRK